MREIEAFDNRRLVERLVRGGFTEEQAETLAEVYFAPLYANLSTKDRGGRRRGPAETRVASE